LGAYFLEMTSLIVVPSEGYIVARKHVDKLIAILRLPTGAE